MAERTNARLLKSRGAPVPVGSNPTPSAPAISQARDDLASSPHVLDHVQAMRLALDHARAAGEAGEVPVGAVAVARGRLIAHGRNAREATHDPSAHAEMVALRHAAAALGSWRLDQVTLYVTLEPCPMCAGALLAARIGHLVFGAPDPKAGACGSLYNLCQDPRLNHQLPVVGGILEAESSALLKSFFARRRSR